MPWSGFAIELNWALAAVVATFLLAGFVKGVVGLGLPTVAIGLLSLIMTPVQAVMLMFIPTLVTNVWQLAIGPSLRPLFKRLWPMLAMIFVGALAGSGIMTGGSHWPSVALGALLVAYAALGLTAIRFHVPPRLEPWLTPVAGLITGFAAAATGLFVVGVPYLQALDLEKDDLVQALGLLFTAGMLAVALVLARDSQFVWSAAGPSIVALAAALAGMAIGQKVRDLIDAQKFRFYFLLGMLVLGGQLIVSHLR